jgi:lysophospholipase L1-like esterase
VTWFKTTAVAAVVALLAAVTFYTLNRGKADESPDAVASAPSTAAASTTGAAPVDWIGTWAVAVQHGTATFADRTIRQIVHTSIGGASTRVRLSNAYGTSPLIVRNVHVARSEGGSTIATGTDRPATFGGKAEVTIAPGDSVTSDPVTFEVPALGDVAVSFYLPGTSGAATIHGLASRDNYSASGDQSTAGRLDGAKKASSYYFLAGLDVRNSDAAGAVVAFGASVTDGFGSAFGQNARWPDLLARRLADSGRTVGVLNAGISGNKLTRDGSGESALARFDRDVLSQPGVRWVIISDDALNDLGDPDPPSAEQLIDAMKQLVKRAHDAGLKVYCSTLTPFEGAGYWTEQGESARQQINAFVRDDAGCDGVIDQDAATRDPDSPTRYLGDYDSGDHLHPNDAGMRAIAEAVDAGIFD